MSENLFNWFKSKATWAIFTLLFIGFIICTALFDQRNREMKYEKMLDGRGWYSSKEVGILFDKIKTFDTEYLGINQHTDGLTLYAITELTVDFVFPFIYCLLIIIPIIHLYSAEKAKYLIWLPIVAAAADLCENFLIASMALTYHDTVSAIAPLAAVFTVIKSALLITCLIGVLPIGAINSIRK
jgi:hypothetical protein